MPIQHEYFLTRKDGVQVWRTYSDLNKVIQKAGTEELYDEAFDVYPIPYIYIETDEDIKVETEDMSF